MRVALDAIAKCGVDLTLCVGDIVDGPGSVDACCDLLLARGVETVCGNHERWLLGGNMRDLPVVTPIESVSEHTLRYLRELPPTRSFETPLGSLLLCHGLGENDMACVRFDDRGYALRVNEELHALINGPHAFVVCGHTRHAMLRVFDGLNVINAGTLNPDQDPCFVILDCDRRVVEHHLLQSGSARLAAEWPLTEGGAAGLRRQRDAD
jgi:predicted phosphodiesterase